MKINALRKDLKKGAKKFGELFLAGVYLYINSLKKKKMNYEEMQSLIETLFEDGFAISPACDVIEKIFENDIKGTPRYTLIYTLFQKAIEQGVRSGKLQMKALVKASIESL